MLTTKQTDNDLSLDVYQDGQRIGVARRAGVTRPSYRQSMVYQFEEAQCVKDGFDLVPLSEWYKEADAQGRAFVEANAQFVTASWGVIDQKKCGEPFGNTWQSGDRWQIWHRSGWAVVCYTTRRDAITVCKTLAAAYDGDIPLTNEILQRLQPILAQIA